MVYWDLFRLVAYCLSSSVPTSSLKYQAHNLAVFAQSTGVSLLLTRFFIPENTERIETCIRWSTVKVMGRI
jgi:hypothetical protein